MKRIPIFLAALLCLLGCNKTDDGTVKEVTARFGFVVKEMNFSDDPPEYELQVGDKIYIHIKGYDFDEYIEQVFKLGQDLPKFNIYCNLAFNGNGWDLVQNGSIIPELEIKGDEKTMIQIECRFTNPKNGLRRRAQRQIHFNDCPESQVIELTFNR